MTPTWAMWSNGNTPKLGWNRSRVRSTKNLQYLRNTHICILLYVQHIAVLQNREFTNTLHDHWLSLQFATQNSKTQVSHRPNVSDWFYETRAFVDSWWACSPFSSCHRTQKRLFPRKPATPVQTEGLSPQEQEMETSLAAESSRWAALQVWDWVYESAAKCRPIILVSRNIRHTRIFARVPSWRGHQVQ